MDNRKYILVFLLIFAFYTGKAQQVVAISFEQADSASNVLFKAANWKQLITYGTQAISAGTDFPALRARLGYARLSTEDYSGALKDYNVVFKNDSYNPTARYYAYLCHKYLNQQLGASYNAGYLDATTLQNEQVTPFGLINTGFESSFKFTDNTYRDNALYNRIWLTNRLSWKWQLDQSVSYFNQSVNNNAQVPGAPLVTGDPDQQLEYYAKLSYAVTENLSLTGGYHYQHTSYKNALYNNSIGIAGVKYTGTYFNIHGDVNLSTISGNAVTQFNAGLMFYPMGNLNFYTVSRGSYLSQNGTGNVIFSQSIGYKLLKNTWAETAGTFGNLDNYIDADGLYIYNAIDISNLKLGETVFYELGKHAQLQLNYTYEKKQDATHNLNYSQTSITTGILWKF